MMMFMSVLARMVVLGREKMLENVKEIEDEMIMNVLIDYQNRCDMMILKEQCIINDYVTLI